MLIIKIKKLNSFVDMFKMSCVIVRALTITQDRTLSVSTTARRRYEENRTNKHAIQHEDIRRYNNGQYYRRVSFIYLILSHFK